MNLVKVGVRVGRVSWGPEAKALRCPSPLVPVSQGYPVQLYRLHLVKDNQPPLTLNIAEYVY